MSTNCSLAVCTAQKHYARMHKGIDSILAELMAKNGDNQVSLSKAAGVGQSTLSRILKPNGPKGIKSPTDDQVSKLAAYYRVSTDQLRGRVPLDSQLPEYGDAVRESAASGGGTPAPKSSADIVKEMLARHGKGLSAGAREKIVSAIQEAQPGYTPSNVITADFSRSVLTGDEIRIAHYDVQGSMGGGKVVHDYPEMFRDVTVSQKHLRELGVTYKDPAHLKIISGDGMSMAPKILHMDPMLSDVSIREYTGDGIYAFTWQGHFFIKSLQIADEDHFWMVSGDDKLYPPRKIRVDDTYIQARILLVWNAQRV